MDVQTLRFTGPDVTDADVAHACVNCSVKCVEIQNCDSITDVSALASIPTLELAHIRDCKRVRCLGSLGAGQTKLRKLDLRGTPVTGAQMRDVDTARVELVLGEHERSVEMQNPKEQLVKSSIEMIREVASQFEAEEIGIAFNGGKDSVVMMDLIQCALGSQRMAQCCVFAIEIDGQEEFSEMIAFRDAFAHAKGIKIVRASASKSMKDGLAHIKEKRGIRLAFMGTRSSDTVYQTKSVERTTQGWPDMLRACPVFHWSYEDIWGYTLSYGLAFCSLYASGYTSIGLADSTVPNPLLRRSDGSFRPAWELDDSSAERKNRVLRAYV